MQYAGTSKNTEFDVVVAHYDSLEFELLFPLVPEARFIVYDKSGSYRGPCRRVPNKGREGGTYLRHIIENYDRLADRTLFIQDDILAHRPNLLSFVGEILMDRSNFHQYPCTWAGGKTIFRRTVVDGMCELHTLGQKDLIKVACEELHIDLPRKYETETCAFFSVSRDTVHVRSSEFYERIMEWLLKSESHGYGLEHMWKIIFA